MADTGNQDYNPQIFMQPRGQDSIIWRLESVDVIERIEHRLKGEFLVEKQMQVEENEEPIKYYVWESDEKAKIMNDSGAKAIVSFIEVLLNKISFLSNITDEEVSNLCIENHIALSREIYDNWSEYAVKYSPGPIVNYIMSLVFLGMKRAQGAGERESLSKIESVIRSVKENEKGGKNFSLFGKGGENNA